MVKEIGDEKVIKKRKSFNLKLNNAEKIEKEAYEKKISESGIVDKLIEDCE